MDAEYVVGRIRILNSVDPNGDHRDYLNGAKVFVGSGQRQTLCGTIRSDEVGPAANAQTGGGNWYSAQDFGGPDPKSGATKNQSKSRWYELSCPKQAENYGLQGKKIRISLDSQNCLSFCGIEVYGIQHYERVDRISNLIVDTQCAQYSVTPIKFSQEQDLDNYRSTGDKREVSVCA